MGQAVLQMMPCLANLQAHSQRPAEACWKGLPQADAVEASQKPELHLYPAARPMTINAWISPGEHHYSIEVKPCKMLLQETKTHSARCT